MASDNEPAKLLLPYLQRADELQKHEPLVAYYCRLYAMERGLKIPQSERTKTTNALLVSLMKQLEKDKKTIQLGPEDNLYLEGFALNVFAKADKQDRAGRADLNTAKTFYAASIFFEILNQFGQVQPDLEQKQKYAVWKAADIRKALKEGREPTPGAPDGDDDLSSSSDRNASGNIETTAVNYQGEPAPKFHDSANIPPSMQFYDREDSHHSLSSPPPSQDFHHPPPSRPSQDYEPPPPSQDFHHPPPSRPSQDYDPPPPSQDYHLPPPSQYYHQQYPADNSQHFDPTYTHENSMNSLPNFQSYPSFTESSLPHFQSYPSFTESSLPAAPSNYSYNQGSDAKYYPQLAPPTTSHSSSAQHSSSSRNVTFTETKPTTQTYQYDSNYQPAPEKIAEAHKAARFAVGALAFDDVSVAVDFLKKSLELLTKPSAGQ
ncbi:hypothetical protein Fmac_030582 [Flemingia macrophylla]|uniref:Uncharacterized protein n=1 Tax=Flemingia macrophylla TaxID=520843 RepID=A0ABD1KZN0_9FABA